MNCFIKVVDIIVACILMFILPAFYFSQKNDILSQQLLSEYTKAFVENVQTQGRLTRLMYEDFIRELSNLPFSCIVEFEHTKYCQEPVYEKEISGKDIFTGTVRRYYDIEYTEMILKKLYEDHGYYFLQNQDIFKVTVKNKDHTLVSSFLQGLTGIELEDNIYAAYSGKIRNVQN